MVRFSIQPVSLLHELMPVLRNQIRPNHHQLQSVRRLCDHQKLHLRVEKDILAKYKFQLGRGRYQRSLTSVSLKEKLHRLQSEVVVIVAVWISRGWTLAICILGQKLPPVL